MASSKNLNVRLKLKYDSYTNWTTTNPVLLKGEIAFATLGSSLLPLAPDATENTTPRDVVLMKVGDGVKAYNDLNFVYANAADVIDAAKSEEDMTTFINGVINNAGLASASSVTTLSGKITTAEGKITALENKVGNTSVSSQISDAITKLNLGSTYATKTEAQGYANAKDTAIAAAKKAGTDAQSDVDALETLVGTLPSGETSVVSYIDKKTSGIATDTALGQVQTDISNLKNLVGSTSVASQITTEKTRAEGAESALGGRIANIEGDYLKASDKTELTDAIATAKTEAIEAVLGESVPADFDTLKEIASWIQADTTASAELVTRVTTAEGDIDALESKVGNSSVSSQISSAISGLNISQYAKVSDLSTTNGKVSTLEGKMSTAEGKISTIEATLGGKVDSSTLSTIATSGNIKDIIQSNGEYVTFDCGTSSTNM